MTRLSPKIEIINHFDNLINRIDIDIEERIKRYNEDQVLGMLKSFEIEHRSSWIYNDFEIEYFDSDESSQNNKSESVIELLESTKVIDYLNQIRERTIDELRNVQKDSLENLKRKSTDLNHIKESKDIEEMKSRLFADKFYFQVIYKPFKEKYSWAFSLFTIVVDFYLTPTEINFLECLINFEAYKVKSILDFFLISDESIKQSFYEQLKTHQYQSHLISFRKQDLLNIKTIRNYSPLSKMHKTFSCSYGYLSKLEKLHLYLSKNCYLEKVRIEGLSNLTSISLKLESIEQSSFGNLNSLKELNLDVKSEINNDLSIKLLEICPNIEELALNGSFSNINFDSFTNLKKLRLCGDLSVEFNFDLFKNICNQLEELWIGFNNMNDENISKLLCGQNFPNVSNLSISYSKITRLEKKLFDGFPMLQLLNVTHNNELKTINNETFSNLKNLKELELRFNQLLSELDSKIFSCKLEKLEKLNLSCNFLKYFDLNILNNNVNIKTVHLFYNPIANKQEIVDHFKRFKINFGY